MPFLPSWVWEHAPPCATNGRTVTLVCALAVCNLVVVVLESSCRDRILHTALCVEKVLVQFGASGTFFFFLHFAVVRLDHQTRGQFCRVFEHRRLGNTIMVVRLILRIR